MQELKNCPFCGNEAQTDFIEGESYIIECYVCRAETGIKDSADQAIAAWNRRATPPSPSTASEVGEPWATLDMIANTGMDARQCMEAARAALAAKTATREEKPSKALLLMDDVDDLIRWASCHAPVELYNKSSSAFWKVCHMIAGTSKPAPACAANPVQPSTGEVDVEAERKLFEACVKPGYLSRCTEPRYTDQYADSHTQMAWKAWLAARRTQAEGARDAVRKAFKELVKKHTHRRPRIVGNDVEYRNEIDTYQIGRDVIDAAIAATQTKE